MKLLYLSCHAILEYDELKLFEELGIDYFSLGSYIDPQNPVDSIRPPLTKVVDQELFHMPHDREELTKEFIDKFDTIIVMHIPKWIIANWEVMKTKRVILRTIGQSTPETERLLAPYIKEGLEVVRYSQREKYIEGNIGCDKIIHFYKDPEQFRAYGGYTREAITFAQNMIDREEYCHFDVFKQIVAGVPAHVYGPKNENAGELNGGFLSYDQMREKYRDSRVYIYTGTQPASYTLNFIEAFMTGIPIVAVGPKIGNSLQIAGKETYQIPDFIQHAVNGYISDDVEQLNQTVKMLLDDPSLCRLIGGQGRRTAIELFGKDMIKSKWKEFLGV